MGEIDIESPTEVRSGGAAEPMNRAVLGGIVAAIAALAIVVAVRTPDDTPAAEPRPETTVQPATSTTAAPTTTEGAADPVPALLAGPLLLGEPSGLELWAGGDAPVSRIDLDSGLVVELDERAHPLFVADRYLVLYHPRRAEYMTIDRSDPSLTMEPIVIEGLGPIHALGPGRTEDFVWIATENGDGFQWLLVSLLTRAPVQSVQTESVHAADFPLDVRVTPGPLLDVRESGIWRLDGATFQPWVDGELIAFGPELALIERCDPECNHRWFDHGAGDVEPTDIPPPQLVLDQVEVMANGEWMHMSTDSASESLLVETFTSRTVDTGLRVPYRIFDVSPDGRWAAVPGSNLMRITDLRTGETANLPRAVSAVIGSSSSVVLTPAIP